MTLPLPAEAPVPAAAESAEVAPLVATADLEVAGRAQMALPETGVSRTLTLPRARIEGGLFVGEYASARVAATAVRSGGDDGYLGIEGESIVPAFSIAEARGALPNLGLAIGMGLVDDPWTLRSEQAFGLRDLGPSLGEEQGWMERSDLGFWAGWTSPQGWISFRADAASGEGARYRERNDGKNLSANLSVRPLAGQSKGGMLQFDVYARDGSRGLTLTQDHRVGARVAADAGVVSGGVELLSAWGVDGDAERTPFGGSAWVVGRPGKRFLAYARLDLTSEDLSDEAASSSVARAGAGLEWRERDDVRVRGILGWERRSAGAHVSSVAGSTALAEENAIFFQLSVSVAARHASDSPDAGGARSSRDPVANPEP